MIPIMVLGALLVLTGLALWILPLFGKVKVGDKEVNLSKLPFIGEVKIPSTFALMVIGVLLFVYPFTPFWPQRTDVATTPATTPQPVGTTTDAASTPTEATSTPTEPVSIPTEALDCSTVQHPSANTELRTSINDGLRRRYSPSNLYVVEVMTTDLRWAYVVAHIEGGSGVNRAYLLSWDGQRWNWQWTGQPGEEPPKRLGYPSSLLLCA